MNMPRITIDYTPAVRQSAGIGRIIAGQVRALLAGDYGFDVRLFVSGTVTPMQREQAPLPLHSTPLSERTMTRLWHRLDLPAPRVEWFTQGPIDLFHATDFVLPPTSAKHKLLTVHDLAFLFYPDAAMPSLHRYLNVVVPRSISRCDHILADSRNTAQDLVEQWHVPESAISVVQGAVDHQRYFPHTDPVHEQALRRRYKLGDDPFVLAVGTLQPRKNFSRLIQAFHAARASANLPHKLVIAGAKGWLIDPIFETVAGLGLAEAVLFPGFVAEEDLPALYSACSFFAYPSLYEGFGLPILEAQACGAPVLTADNSCLPEAGGDGALYVNAESVADIAAAIVRLAQDSELRDNLRRRGFKNAAGFTWERSAAQLAAAYRSVL